VRYAWATEETEEEAALAILTAPCHRIPCAATLYEHITWYLSEADRPCFKAALSARADDLCLLLRMVRASGRPIFLCLPPAKRQSPTAMVRAIGACRHAWCRIEAGPLGNAARQAAVAGALAAASLLLNTPCGSRAGAEALRAHLRWFVPELERASLESAAGLLECLRARLTDLETLFQGSERLAVAA
jgi:hypothetical protein